ncbi:hypothetical protein [Lactiplantibacillus plantarum]|uniref:hypothetical protein n=3 Tax=Lactobacillaceae TaxID=33958 RepID=UPI003C6CAD08
MMKMNRPKFEYNAPPIRTNQLNTPVRFFRTVKNLGPEPGRGQTEQVFECLGLAYDPSTKDREVLNVNEAKYGVTIKIRDTFGEFDPTTKDTVVIDDRRYLDATGQPIVWDVIQVAPDLENNAFVKIVLGVTK